MDRLPFSTSRGQVGCRRRSLFSSHRNREKLVAQVARSKREFSVNRERGAPDQACSRSQLLRLRVQLAAWCDTYTKEAPAVACRRRIHDPLAPVMCFGPRVRRRRLVYDTLGAAEVEYQRFACEL